jgi:hypothetical protein
MTAAAVAPDDGRSFAHDNSRLTPVFMFKVVKTSNMSAHDQCRVNDKLTHPTCSLPRLLRYALSHVVTTM